MDVDMTVNFRKRLNGMDCIWCFKCENTFASIRAFMAYHCTVNSSVFLHISI